MILPKIWARALGHYMGKTDDDICLAIVVLITSAISMTYSQYDVWIAVFCLALLNIVDLAEKEI